MYLYVFVSLYVILYSWDIISVSVCMYVCVCIFLFLFVCVSEYLYVCLCMWCFSVKQCVELECSSCVTICLPGKQWTSWQTNSVLGNNWPLLTYLTIILHNFSNRTSRLHKDWFKKTSKIFSWLHQERSKITSRQLWN